MVLARGDSLAFLLIEGSESLLMVALIILGYEHWGLLGTGIAIDATYILDLLIVYMYTRVRYGYRGTLPVLLIAGIQVPLGVAVYLLTLLADGLLYWTLGGLVCMVSLTASVYILHQKSSLWKALTTKLRSRFYADA